MTVSVYDGLPAFTDHGFPPYTMLQKAIQSISEEAWLTINEYLVQFFKERKIEGGRSIRMDTTVGETNILFQRTQGCCGTAFG
jgi:hypothetical protein